MARQQWYRRKRRRSLQIAPIAHWPNAPPLIFYCSRRIRHFGRNSRRRNQLPFCVTRHGARYITSVMHRHFDPGAAGLLRGYRATTHWLTARSSALGRSDPLFRTRRHRPESESPPVAVTAGIDFGLTIAAELFGRPVAERIQLMMEYFRNRFDSGSP